MQNKLIPLTDFVLNIDTSFGDYQEVYLCISRYAEFLRQPLKLEMFIPIDENKQPMLPPGSAPIYTHSNEYIEKYKSAKERILFHGWSANKEGQPVMVKKPYSDMSFDFYFREDGSIWQDHNDRAPYPIEKSIEDMLSMDLWYTQILTPTALEMIYRKAR